MTVKRLCVLGSTGSVGESVLAVAAANPGRFIIDSLTASTSVEALYRQCLAHRPRQAVMADAQAARQLERRLHTAGVVVEVRAGVDALQAAAAADTADTVVAGIVGAAGLAPTLSAATAGKIVLLANKEALVMTGPLFMDAVRGAGARLIPVDSEQNAIFQCLTDYRCNGGTAPAGMRRLLLTASGGPFLRTPFDAFDDITPDQACAHPNWSMGRKISVDSATMMNKGLEIIETAWLFGVDEARIEVVIHPQSIVHSMVEFDDGAVLAQLGAPDMRLPIAHALGWPERIGSGAPRLDLTQAGQLEFEAPDPHRFPALELARAALRQAGTAGAVFNAANEVAVAAFLDGALRFSDIVAVTAEVLEGLPGEAAESLPAVLEADAAARRAAQAVVARRTGG